jgi:hypothetical protein
MRWLLPSAAVVCLCLFSPLSAPSGAAGLDLAPVRTLDGSGNNLLHPDWGKVGTQYLRVASPNYADGVAAMVGGPPTRYVSNRVFNDVHQNVFSENAMSQYGWVWGQFMDHVFGLREESTAEPAPIAFDPYDPLEEFQNDFGAIGFERTPAAPGTGVISPRQQINTVSSYIDAWNVYGGTNQRLDWLRRGPQDGNPTNNRATLLLSSNYLPHADARGDVGSAPTMALMGRLTGNPAGAVVAGDVRANENIALTGMHTLFAREHNRIVAALPLTLSDEEKFQIARRVVGAEEQYITYTEFLPAMGVQLAQYTGYNPTVNSSLSNEFAVVGYRAHSQIHGEMEPTANASRYTPEQLEAFEAQGIEVEHEDDDVTLVIPLNVAFGNPDLLQSVGIGPLLKGLAFEKQYRNDEQIDNQLRSVLFQVPKPGVDPSECSDGPPLPQCFSGVADLGAIDVERGRDHGLPSYNGLRTAYGLSAKTSFKGITGEASETLPAGMTINDPGILDFVQLRDRFGNIVQPGTPEANEEVVTGIRRSTLAARLKAVYGDVTKVDAFVGMVSEPHVAGSELGPLQLAIWKKQFEALRDGDRFFYANDPVLTTIQQLYGIDFRLKLSQVIELNTGANVPDNVFKVVLPPAPGVRINSGGGTVDASSGTFSADTSFSGGFLYSTGAAISGTPDPALYQNERWGQFSYAIPVANGPYDVRLHFVEIWWGTAVSGSCLGKRLFGMDVLDTPGPPDISNLDICARVGPRKALVLTVPGVNVTDGFLNVKSVPGAADNPELAAIEVVPAGAPPPPSPPPPVVLLGDQQVQPDKDSNQAGRAEAFATTASASGTLTGLTVYVDATSTATSLIAGLYADSGGHPGALLTQGVLAAPAAGDWNSVPLTPAAIAGGTKYWIALLAPVGTLAFHDRCCTVAGSGPTETSALTGLGSLPAAWSTGTVFDDAPASAYGTG